MIELIKERRTIYNLDKNIEIGENKIFDFIKDATEYVPDAFNMKSSKVIVLTGEKQNELWDRIYDYFGGKVAREKIDGFKKAYGTILYFYDENVVKSLQEKYPIYSENFPKWAMQASAMLQFTIWTGLREMNIGANLQHYNPAIEAFAKEFLGVDDNYVLVAQMPFGRIVSLPEDKVREVDIDTRVKFLK